MKRSSFFKSLAALIVAPSALASLPDKKAISSPQVPAAPSGFVIPNDIIRITTTYENIADVKRPRAGDILVSDLGHKAIITSVFVTGSFAEATGARNLYDLTIMARTIDGQLWRHKNFYGYKILNSAVSENEVC